MGVTNPLPPRPIYPPPPPSHVAPPFVLSTFKGASSNFAPRHAHIARSNCARFRALRRNLRVERRRLLHARISCESSDDLSAVPCSTKVTIYNAATFQEIATLTNADVVDAIEWSPDSKLLMCVLLKPKLVQVWHPEDTSWKCRISEGSLGLISACWSPDSQHILTTADFQIRTTVWSLVEKAVLYLKQAKLPLSLQSFSQCGEHLAVVERRDAKDFVSIINCKTWTLEQLMLVETVAWGKLFDYVLPEVLTDNNMATRFPNIVFVLDIKKLVVAAVLVHLTPGLFTSRVASGIQDGKALLSTDKTRSYFVA
ncbi:hypothetical protein HPB50_012499 [Hyalomma asiaticum]|uniref:Uncharacterized protein n=1 Tax=Hyalomma asiaticum TaxID=266040 RepID=A0ACB7SE56_HYAAI|nr:hypothetical protein HPB50_012499 [Hyalomma asiaticum]